jgi:hypothetical protein
LVATPPLAWSSFVHHDTFTSLALTPTALPTLLVGLARGVLIDIAIGVTVGVTVPCGVN